MNRNPALDGLRAVAVLAVIEHHAYWHVLGIQGALGVDVFFVLSGFLITSILLREVHNSGICLRAFYLRRARRLYPALCGLVVVLMAARWIDWRGALNALLYLGDYVGPSGFLAHTWSLAVEEHFYLIWPLLLPFVARMSRRDALILLLVVYVLAVAWSQFNGIAWRDQYRFDTRLSGLVFGCALAFLPVRSMLPFGMLCMASMLLLAGFPMERVFAESATGALILLSYQTRLPFVTYPALTYIGRISYGIYLYQTPVIWFVSHNLGIDGLLGVLTSIALSLALASVSFHTIEAYFRKPRTDQACQTPTIENPAGGE